MPFLQLWTFNFLCSWRVCNLGGSFIHVQPKSVQSMPGSERDEKRERFRQENLDISKAEGCVNQQIWWWLQVKNYV